MKKIYKYELGNLERQTIRMPLNAEILACHYQNGILCLWALVDISLPDEERSFYIYGTGWDFELLEYNHINTLQKDGFVWHIFESRN